MEYLEHLWNTTVLTGVYYVFGIWVLALLIFVACYGYSLYSVIWKKKNNS